MHLLVLNDDSNAISAMITCASLALMNANVVMFDILVGVNLISHVSKSDERKNQTISVAVFPQMRQIANLMSTCHLSLSDYNNLLRWDGPLKEALQMYEIVKLHWKKSDKKEL